MNSIPEGSLDSPCYSIHCNKKLKLNYLFKKRFKLLVGSRVKMWFCWSLGPSTVLKKDKYRRKAKGRRCCLGEQKLFSSLPPQLLFNRTIWRIGWIHPFLQIILMQFILFFKSSLCKELNKFCPSNSSDDICPFFCIYPSSMLDFLCLSI